jgi:hypothetical protein
MASTAIRLENRSRSKVSGTFSKRWHQTSGSVGMMRTGRYPASSGYLPDALGR